MCRDPAEIPGKWRQAETTAESAYLTFVSSYAMSFVAANLAAGAHSSAENVMTRSERTPGGRRELVGSRKRGPISFHDSRHRSGQLLEELNDLGGPAAPTNW
jgi:hypothetical protein